MQEEIGTERHRIYGKDRGGFCLNKPLLKDLVDKADSRYTLVVLAAKRARQITEEEPELMQAGLVNPVSVALQEIADGEITYERNKIGIK